MTENMQKMMNLVDEFNKLVETSNAEKKRLETETLIANQERFDKFLEDMKPFTQIAIKLQSYVFVKTETKSCYGDDYNYIRVNPRYDSLTVFSGKRSCVGSIPYNGKYKDKNYWYSNLRYDLDAILDAWDRDLFEKRFAEEVINIVEKKARVVNANLESAKERHDEVIRGLKDGNN